MAVYPADFGAGPHILSITATDPMGKSERDFITFSVPYTKGKK